MSDFKSPSLLSTYAARATGAMFFSIFGGDWLILWNHRARQDNVLICLLVAVIAIGMFSLAIKRYRFVKIYAADDGPSLETKRKAKLFHIINSVQWIIILVLANVLINLGMSAWVIPMGMLVIGLHFLPLAIVFAAPSHFWLGLAMSGYAISYPFIFSGGAGDPYGCLGAGLMLWAYAAWKLAAGWGIILSEIQQYRGYAN